MEVWSTELVTELRRQHAVTLHALPGRSDGGPPRARALVAFGFRTALAVLRDAGRYEVLQGGDMALWPLVWLARLRSPAARAALAAHGTDVAYADRSGILPALYGAYLRLGARLLPDALVVANSSATAKLTRLRGFPNVVVVPLATRIASSAPPEPEPFLLFAGRIVRRKGLSWFVANVLPRLPASLPLKVAGTVWDDSERSALCQPRVEYLGPLAQVEVIQLMGRATAVVIPNIPAGRGHFEGFGLVAVEAAAAGGVVLAARLDGFADSVIDRETGFLIEPRSVERWVAAVQRVTEWSAHERRRFTTRAQRSALVHFSWERVGHDIVASWQCAAE